MNSANPAARSTVYVLVDGENVDGTLSTILSRPPQSDDRPRWEMVHRFAERLWGGRTAKPMFFINVRPEAPVPWPFVQALQACHFRPVLLTGAEGRKVVDDGIQKTLDALEKRNGDVLLLSHDKDFCARLAALGHNDERHIAVLAFKEYLAADYGYIQGLDVFDLEVDARAFPNGPLPRMRPIPIEEFDPDMLLDSL